MARPSIPAAAKATARARPAGPAPDGPRLHEAALRHLARFATTEAGLVRVLDRRVQRWARAAALEAELPDGIVETCRAAVRAVARSLAAAGVVDDAAFASARAARLARAGRSRRTVAAHLSAKGVPKDVADAALPDPGQDLSSAVVYARKRRLGTFGAATDDPETERAARQRDLGRLARAGYSRDVAEQALDISLEAAEALLAAARGR